MTDIKIFVADDVSESGLEPLRAAGFALVKRTGLKGAELAEAVRGADGLVVRSETQRDGRASGGVRASARDRARGRRR